MSVEILRGGSFAVLGTMLGSCGCSGMDSAHAPSLDDGLSNTIESAVPQDPCAVLGTEGCPCSESGTMTECGQVTSASGDYVSCSFGTTTCDGSVWGPCMGNRVVATSQSLRSQAPYTKHSATIASSSSSPCDPTGQQIAGELSDVDAGGLTVTDAGISLTETTSTDDRGSGPCTGLWCQVTSCSGGVTTSISGKVYDPAEKNPLYNAYVYIPVDATAALPPFAEGASCDTCAGAASVSAIAVAQTGPDGSFVLQNVPAGSGVPLVVQMGKWRRKTILPTLTACADNPIASSDSRLPRNRFDGAGNVADIPRMAIASGSADPFECLLLKAGIDADEIQVPGSGARIDYYRYNGKDRYPGGAPAGLTLTGSLATLKQYDAVLLPCEGRENAHNAQATNVVEFTTAGGRVFTTHYGYVWLATPSPAGVANNLTEFFGSANWDIGRADFTDPMTASVDQSFPKGVAFAEWLQNVDATSVLGSMTIVEPRHNAISAVTGKSQRWISGSSKVAVAGTDDMLLAMTFNTPLGAAEEQRCGRVVFSDFHVSADALVSTSGCSTNSDCGGATCDPAIAGRCVPSTCRTGSDCSSGEQCVGARLGTCSARSCWRDSDCNGGLCSNGRCPTTTCNANSDCGRRSACSGGDLGQCQRPCSVASDCSAGSTCVSGVCQKGCFLNSECWTGVCDGASPSSCSWESNMFPASCRSGDLSAQEKALEFMLFDLTACVSPDSWSPPAPTTEYRAGTFNLDFVAQCGSGTLPVWRELQWQAQIPSSADITFSAATAPTADELEGAPAVQLAVATSDTAVGSWDTALIETTTGSAFYDASPPIASLEALRIAVTLNPTSDAKASPLLSAWQVLYDCKDNL